MFVVVDLNQFFFWGKKLRKMHCESADAERQESTTKKGNNEIKLTAEQKAKIENNRQRALLLREKKRKNLTTNEYVLRPFRTVLT